MTIRLRWFLLSVMISLSMWMGLISGGIYMLNDGMNTTLTASLKQAARLE